MMDYQEQEIIDGLRMTWNCIPNTPDKLKELVIPLACLYTPMKMVECPPRLEYPPCLCKTCGASLSHCSTLVRNTDWYCPFCLTSNRLPTSYTQMLESGEMPPECESGVSTVEYILEAESDLILDNVFIFVIDVSVGPSEIRSIRKSLKEVMLKLPENTQIAILTYSRYIRLYELETNIAVKSLIIDGNETKTPAQYCSDLSLRKTNHANPTGPYFANVQQNLDHINCVIDSIKSDPWKGFVPGERDARALGSTLSLAIAMAGSYISSGIRIELLIGGPTTIGGGAVAALPHENMIRSHYNIMNNDEKGVMYSTSAKYYDAFVDQLIAVNATVDVYGFSLDQFGMAEMRNLVNKTGGYSVIQEEFGQQVFVDSLKSAMGLNEYDELKLGSGANLKMFASKPIRVKGALGPISSKKNKSKLASSDLVGEGETDHWYVGGLDPCLTLTFFLDVAADPQIPGDAFFQFMTRYKHPSGKAFVRVTSFSRKLLSADPKQYLHFLDQDAAIATYGKLAAEKSLEMEAMPIVRWLDRHLILAAKKFSNFTPNQPNTFNMPEELRFMPQFFYYLRKSWFVKKFATSVDESVYYRLAMDRETVGNCLVMIQPSLTRYSVEDEYPEAAPCDIASLKDNVILLVDTYFYIVTWYGLTIKSWIDQEYDKQEGFEHFKTTLEMPEEDMKLLIQDRLIIPKFAKSIQGDGQERLIKSKINPSSHDMGNATVDGGNFITDDKSLDTFMEHLIKAVVASS